MRSDAGMSDELVDAMERVTDQASRASQIVRWLRDFTSKGESRQVQANINEIVRETVSFAEDEARGHGVTLRLELTESAPHIFVDRIQIEQVILNLIRNGIEAMGNLDAENRQLTVCTSPAGDKGVEVAVHDTGSGLSPETADRIFDPFFTTKADGMGMGLAISRTIIEAHQGRLWATPGRDRGAVFRFTLPTKRDANG
jgi:C4-dicarboxylate-specific signal transduction histidine kinase